MAATAAVEDISPVEAELIERAIQEQEEEYEDEDFQLFQEHEDLHRRLGKSLYYGGSEASSTNLSLPLTELCVDHFNRVLEINQEDLDMTKAAQITRETCASPTALVLALLYLDRLRGSNPGYLASVSSTDLFLVSLMVASKYLYDDGEDDEVFNEEWATSAGLNKKQLNQLEIDFLVSSDWKLHVTLPEFEKTAKMIEKAVAKKQLGSRKWEDFTYTDLVVLSRNLAVWDQMLGLALKVTTVVVAAYAASLMSMLGTCHLLNQVKLGPNAISDSVTTLYTSLSRSPPPPSKEIPQADTATDDELRRFNETAEFCVIKEKCELPIESAPSRCPFKNSFDDVMDIVDVMSDWRYKRRRLQSNPRNVSPDHRSDVKHLYIDTSWLH